jgi:hypothetical protein
VGGCQVTRGGGELLYDVAQITHNQRSERLVTPHLSTGILSDLTPLLLLLLLLLPCLLCLCCTPEVPGRQGLPP